MSNKSTHTLAELEIPKEVWKLIYDKLDAAGYQHALDDEAQTIDMTGIQLVPEVSKRKPFKCKHLNTIRVNTEVGFCNRCTICGHEYKIQLP